MNSDILSKLVPYGDLSKKLLATLNEKTNMLNLQSGSTVFTEGSEAGSIYFLLKGKVLLEQKNGAKTSRGPSALCFSQGYKTYRHTASTEEASVILQLMIKPEEQDALLCWEFAYRFLNQSPWILSVHESGMFDHIAASNILKFAQSFEKIEIESGQTFIKENDYERLFYVMLEGLANVFQGKISEASKPISQIKPLQTFGEASLMEDLPRNATINAATQSTMMRLDTTKIDALSKDIPDSAFINGAAMKQKLTNKEALLLDIRPEKEAKLSPLKEAILIPMTQAASLLNQIQSNQSYIVYSPYPALNKLVYQLITTKATSCFILKQA